MLIKSEHAIVRPNQIQQFVDGVLQIRQKVFWYTRMDDTNTALGVCVLNKALHGYRISYTLWPQDDQA